jgi:hypothetical protein
LSTNETKKKKKKKGSRNAELEEDTIMAEEKGRP